MTIGTPRLHQQNVELFSRLNEELKSLQGQVGSGKAELKLSRDLHDISRLSASEEKKSETKQFIENAKRATNDLEFADLSLDRLQNLIIRFQELAVESGNDVLTNTERQRFIDDAKSIKQEMFEIANTKDSFGNSLFGGVAGNSNPFQMKSDGSVSFVGSALTRDVMISPTLSVSQNLSGQEVFQNIGQPGEKYSIFDIADNFITSLQSDLNSGSSSNLLSEGNSVDLIFPSSGAEAKLDFILKANGLENKISTSVYGNDYTSVKNAINSLTASTGISASVVSGNRIRLQGTIDTLNLEQFSISNYDKDKSTISVIKDVSTSNVTEKLTENRLQNSVIRTKIGDAFEHISTARAEIASSSRRAQENEAASQEILVTLEENISDLKDADLASLLTQIEFLMTNKEAAQATFTRITSKSLFDFLG